jgi:hypothetical protein
MYLSPYSGFKKVMVRLRSWCQMSRHSIATGDRREDSDPCPHYIRDVGGFGMMLNQ